MAHEEGRQRGGGQGHGASGTGRRHGVLGVPDDAADAGLLAGSGRQRGGLAATSRLHHPTLLPGLRSAAVLA